MGVTCAETWRVKWIMDDLRPGSHPCREGDPPVETLFLFYAGEAGCPKLLHGLHSRAVSTYLPRRQKMAADAGSPPPTPGPWRTRRAVKLALVGPSPYKAYESRE